MVVIAWGTAPSLTTSIYPVELPVAAVQFSSIVELEIHPWASHVIVSGIVISLSDNGDVVL